MRLKLLRKPNRLELQNCIQSMVEAEDVKSLLILACDADGHLAEETAPMLAACTKPIFGGIFPQIMYGQEKLERGTIVAGLAFQVHVGSITQMGDGSGTDFDQRLLELFGDHELTGKTMFVFVDGLSRGISKLIDSLFNNLGLLPNYIGGGAGSLSFLQKPCLFTNQGLLEDAAVLALADTTSSVGVAHGWTPISEAIRVTESEGNMVISLNWRPAFEVYREIVENHSGQSFAQISSFFELAKSYPLGIAKLDAEMIVRDPIIHDNGRLVCVGDIPLGSLIHILSGDIDSLIRGAKSARELAEASFSGMRRDASMVFVDCISRVLFLQNHFSRELAAVECGLPLIGALTLGEIANNGDAYLEFYNKTSVVGIFHPF